MENEYTIEQLHYNFVEAKRDTVIDAFYTHGWIFELLLYAQTKDCEFMSSREDYSGLLMMFSLMPGDMNFADLLSTHAQFYMGNEQEMKPINYGDVGDIFINYIKNTCLDLKPKPMHPLLTRYHMHDHSSLLLDADSLVKEFEYNSDSGLTIHWKSKEIEAADNLPKDDYDFCVNEILTDPMLENRFKHLPGFDITRPMHGKFYSRPDSKELAISIVKVENIHRLLASCYVDFYVTSTFTNNGYNYTETLKDYSVFHVWYLDKGDMIRNWEFAWNPHFNNGAHLNIPSYVLCNPHDTIYPSTKSLGEVMPLYVFFRCKKITMFFRPELQEERFECYSDEFGFRQNYFSASIAFPSWESTGFKTGYSIYITKEAFATMSLDEFCHGKRENDIENLKRFRKEMKKYQRDKKRRVEWAQEMGMTWADVNKDVL